MSDTRSLVVERPRAVPVVEGTAAPVPDHGEALVRVAHVGVCGSDRELVAGTRDPAFVRYPVVPGHEWSGTVESLGEGTDPCLLGRRVVGEGFRSCGACDACRRGQNTLCLAGYSETGFTVPGACADLLVLPARLLHVLPDDADLRAAALLEPAACAAAATLAAAVVPGERVAVVGGGTLGLLATQLLAASGPAELVVVDPRHRSAAAEAGATELRTPDEAPGPAGRFDVVLEAAGARGAGRTAFDLVRRGGRLVLTGLHGGPDDGFTPAELVTAAVSVHTVFGAPSSAWSHAVRAFAAGLLRPLSLISDELLLEDAPRVLRPGVALPLGKVLLHP